MSNEGIVCKVCGGALSLTEDNLPTTSPDIEHSIWICTECGMRHMRTVVKDAGEITGDTVDVIDNSEEAQKERAELQAKLERLVRHKNDIEAMRKAMTKDYRDQLSTIKDEITDVLVSLKDL